jgi:predicted TIM-barrel fold metal-dependent hydrolase
VTLSARLVIVCFVAISWTVTTHVASAADVLLVDAHSQVDATVSMDRVLSALNEAGISRVILSSLHGSSRTPDIMALAAAHPDRITPSIGLKGGFRAGFIEDAARAQRILTEMGANPRFGAISEMMIWHEQKGQRAPQVEQSFDAPQVRAGFALALDRHWPIVLHIEFGFARETGHYDQEMRGLEHLLAEYPQHPIALTHMGQLGPGEARRLIEAHENIYFLVSHANPLFIERSGGSMRGGRMPGRSGRIPWTNLFSGSSLAAQWRELMLAHPQHFVFALDSVYDEDWGPFYVSQVRLWRKALDGLPGDVANAIGHHNAELLWHLPPAAAAPDH